MSEPVAANNNNGNDGGSGRTGDLEKFIQSIEGAGGNEFKLLYPLKVLILGGASVEAIERVHKMRPADLKSSTFVFACKHGANKEILLWLANHVCRIREEDYYLACQHQPQLHPDVIYAMNEKLDDEISLHEAFVDSSYTRVFSLFAFKLKMINAEDHVSWTHEGLFDFVRTTFSCTTLEKLRFRIPSTLRREKGESCIAIPASWHELVTHWISTGAKCGIQDLEVRLDSEKHTVALLAGIYHLPLLKSLKISFHSSRIEAETNIGFLKEKVAVVKICRQKKIQAGGEKNSRVTETCIQPIKWILVAIS